MENEICKGCTMVVYPIPDFHQECILGIKNKSECPCGECIVKPVCMIVCDNLDHLVRSQHKEEIKLLKDYI